MKDNLISIIIFGLIFILACVGLGWSISFLASGQGILEDKILFILMLIASIVIIIAFIVFGIVYVVNKKKNSVF